MAYDPNIENWPTEVIRADLDTVLRQPVVSLHASLHDTEPFPSRAMIDDDQAHTMMVALESRQAGGLFINAGRGELMTRSALDILLESPWTVVMDTWPGEPVLSAETLAKIDWISPHIAGHSAQARERGSDMLADSIVQWSRGLAGVVSSPPGHSPMNPLRDLSNDSSSDSSVDPTEWLYRFLLAHSVLPREDARMRAYGAAGLSASDFDVLRSRYVQPDEWTGRRINMVHRDPGIVDIATRLGVLVSDDQGER